MKNKQSRVVPRMARLAKMTLRRGFIWLVRLYAAIAPGRRTFSPPSAPKRVLLLMGAHIGDTIIATSLIPILRSAYPDVEIGFATGSWSQMVIQGHPEIAFTHVIDHWRLNRGKESLFRKWEQYRRSRRKALREIRALGYDLAICAYPWMPDFLNLAWRVRIPVRVAFTGSIYAPLATITAEYPSSPFILQGACQAELLRALGIQEPHLSRRRSILAPDTPDAISEVCRLFGAQTLEGLRYRIIHVGTGASCRELPVVFWRELAVRLSDHKLLFTGRGPREKQAIQEITRDLPHCIDACDNLGWAAYVAAVRHAEKLYGVESMAGHVAAAVGTSSSVVYSGVAGVARWRPDGTSVTVFSNPVACSPCHRMEGCAEMTCLRGFEPVHLVHTELFSDSADVVLQFELERVPASKTDACLRDRSSSMYGSTKLLETAYDESYVKFAGITFSGLSKDRVLAWDDGLKVVCTVNAQHIRLSRKNKPFAAALNSAMVTFDGSVPLYLARVMNRKARIEKISGSDLIYDLFEIAAQNGYRIFLLGASAKANQDAISVAIDRYGVEVQGCAPEPFAERMNSAVNSEILELLYRFRPHFLFVGFGAPKQELWIESNRDALEAMGVKIAVGCGGSIDFLAGKYRRAPRWLQTLGMEGFYRLAQEPSWKRIKRLLESMTIFAYAFRD